MNSWERVMNTLQGRPVDRTPVFAVLSLYGARLSGVDLRTLYGDADAYVASQKQVQDTFGFDLVLAPFDYCTITEAFGGEIVYFKNQPPNMKRPGAKNAEEVLALPMPDPRTTARLPVVLEATRRLGDLYRDRTPLFAAVPGCCILPSLIMGLESWIETLTSDPPAAQKVLEHTANFFVEWTNVLAEAGVFAVVVPEGMAAVEIATRELFQEQLLPHLRSTFAKVRCPIVFHHTGGNIHHILDLLPGLPRLAGVIVGPQDDLGEARRRLGPDLTLLGNLDNVRFPAMSPADVRRKCMACLDAGTTNGRFILSNSGPDIPIETPPENLHAMIAASCDYSEGKRE